MREESRNKERLDHIFFAISIIQEGVQKYSKRNVLVHDYIRISPEILWDTIVTNIPELKTHIMQMRANYNDKELTALT